ncbi:hypothetical protein GE061_004171 [Apolygus lucorum]|uniref:Uncharacterized protein n=1 Tax=Apolygus lucorum TaxID=248454 RepID=A0A8S9X123_APOLU|nr:hypothetical protein GE061_004171 [Apolygus lucorum]
MLKFIRGKTQQPSAERQKLQKELFAFRKTVQHGFPNKPTCLAWDPILRIMAIGTATGALKVYPLLLFSASINIVYFHVINGLPNN